MAENVKKLKNKKLRSSAILGKMAPSKMATKTGVRVEVVHPAAMFVVEFIDPEAMYVYI